MNESLVETLVFRDGRGRYYLVPCSAVEAYSVPRTQASEVEQAIGAEDPVHLGYPTSPKPIDRPGLQEPFRGLTLLGQWPLPEGGM